MTDEQVRAASDVLWEHWHQGHRMTTLPETIRPQTREAGYAVQAWLERACGETCVCELSDTLRVVQPKVSRHRAHLKRAGLVEARRNGKWTHYRWAKHGDPLVCHVLGGLREWMAKDDRMDGERRRRNKVCCEISRRKPKRTKTK